MQSITRPENAWFALESGEDGREGTDMAHGRSLPLFLTMCFGVAAAPAAQVTTADIVGRITDTTGGVNNIPPQMQFAAKLLF